MSIPLATTGNRARRAYINRLIKKPWSYRARRSVAFRKHLDKHGYITPHFTWRSYACTDGTPVPRSLKANAIRLHWKLEDMRHRIGDKPMTVDGPYRTVARNRAVGGAQNSRHTYADAADFYTAQVATWGGRGHILAIAYRVFALGGVGNETSGTLHVDARGYKARFVTWVASR